MLVSRKKSKPTHALGVTSPDQKQDRKDAGGGFPTTTTRAWRANERIIKDVNTDVNLTYRRQAGNARV